MQQIQAYSHISTFLPTSSFYPPHSASSFLEAYFAFRCIFNYTQRFLSWTTIPNLSAVMREQERYMSKVYKISGFHDDSHFNPLNIMTNLKYIYRFSSYRTVNTPLPSYAYNVTLRYFRKSLLPWKSKEYYIFECACAHARYCVCRGAWACACM